MPQDTPPGLQIPWRLPRLLREISVITNPWGWTQAPVVANEVIALAGGSDDAHGSVAYLEVLDRRTLERRFIKLLDCERDELTTSQPTIAPDGSIAISLFDRDARLYVQRISSDGAVVSSYDILEAERVPGADTGTKLMLSSVVPADGGSELFSYSYRQGRKFHVSRRVRHEVLWSAADFLEAAVQKVALCRTMPHDDDEDELNARAMDDGRLLWSEPLETAALGDFFGSMVLLTDWSDRRDEWERREQRLEEAVLGDAISDDEYKSQRIFALSKPSHLRAIDAQTGKERWKTPVFGDITSVASHASGLSVLSTEWDGVGRLTHLSLSGEIVGEQSVEGQRTPGDLRWQGPWLTIIARDSERVLWTDDRELHCAECRATTGSSWSMPLPVQQHAFAPLIADRIISRSSVVALDRRILFRADGRLWVFGED